MLFFTSWYDFLETVLVEVFPRRDNAGEGAMGVKQERNFTIIYYYYKQHIPPVILDIWYACCLSFLSCVCQVMAKGSTCAAKVS